MRSISSIIIVIAFAACSSGDGGRGEFDNLENALTSLANAPEADWIDRLEKIEQMEIVDPGVREARNLCVSAYRAFGAATVKLHAARGQVAAVESSLDTQQDAGVDALSSLRKTAQAAVDDVTNSLDKAESLVKSCAERRTSLRNELAAR
jgi:hypothetical protein